MAMSEKSRTTVYQHLSPMLGEEATAEMLSCSPARDSAGSAWSSVASSRLGG